MRKIIGVILGIALVIGIIYFSGGVETIGVLQNSNLNYLALALLMQAAIVLLYTLRLWIIISEQKYEVSFMRVFEVLISGMAINQLTPVVKAGGEPIKGYYLSKSGMTVTKASASVVIEITSELVSFYTSLIIVIFYLAVTSLLSGEYLLIGLGVSFLFLIAFIFAFRIMLNRKKLEKFIKRYITVFFKTEENLPFRISSSIVNLFYNRSLNIKIYFISFVCRVLEFLRIYFIFIAIGYPVSPDLILLVWALSVILSMIPWLPGGLGLVEGGTISTLLVFGVPTAISSSMVLVDRFLSIWLPVIMGGAVLYFLDRNTRRNYS